MRRRFAILWVLIVGAVGATAAPAAAVTPTTEVIPINFSFTPKLLSKTCGFTVTRHVEGTLAIRTFYDTSGNLVRELDQYNLVETISANGKTFTAHTIQNITVTLLPNWSYTVSFVGTDFRLPIPGAGIALVPSGASYCFSRPTTR